MKNKAWGKSNAWRKEYLVIEFWEYNNTWRDVTIPCTYLQAVRFVLLNPSLDYQMKKGLVKIVNLKEFELINEEVAL
jgi:hypothetical protein